ncbi:amyloid fiber anchoring/assembly protein TapA [Bacillus haikouensis]|uniref:amyloid fiber anchoring/assembly protein TapA n=1 Tax=Bacillus haikouensis TaxID=1510468 RepID=UPI0028A7FE47|nr:amyloid fiber anchoring/assembly protein TapA [Bacillus haikouensis]
MIPIRYTRTKKHKTSFKKWKLLCQIIAIWYATTITSSFINGSTGAYFNDQDQRTSVITAGTWSSWDKSSLKFPDEQDRKIEACSPAEISVRIKNTGSTMEGPTEYSVYYAAKGNPKKGSSIVEGEIQPIINGEISALKATVGEPGNYKFKALQRPGHGNKEDIRHELWSETITITCEQDKPEEDKGGGKAKPEPPKKEEKQEVTSPDAANKDQSKEENKEENIVEPSPPVEEKQEPEQPAAPAESEPEKKPEEKAEVKAASEPQPDVQPVKKKDPEKSAEEPSSTDNNSPE